MRAAVLIVVLLVVALTLTTSGHVFADLLQGASKQRIGNYDVEMTTEPKSPTVGVVVVVVVQRTF